MNSMQNCKRCANILEKQGCHTTITIRPSKAYRKNTMNSAHIDEQRHDENSIIYRSIAFEHVKYK